MTRTYLQRQSSLATHGIVGARMSLSRSTESEPPSQGDGSCAWASVPDLPDREERLLKERARQLQKARGAVLVAHYYVDADLQE